MTDQFITVSQTTNCGGTSGCLRDGYLTEAELCERVKTKTASMASLATFNAVGAAAGARNVDRGLVPAAPFIVVGDQICLAPNITAPVYFKIQEVDKLYDAKDKCSCDGCKDSIEFEVEANNAVMTNFPILTQFPDADPALLLQIFYNSATPNVVMCTKQVPVKCCCSGGSNGPDYVTYGITICYTIGILTPLCFVDPPTEPFPLEATIVYAVQVRRLDSTHYREVDCADGTPGFRTWVKTGVKNLVIPPSTEESMEAIVSDPHAAAAAAHGHCKPCPPPDPCDCAFTKVAVPYATLAEFRVKTDDPCKVCGVDCVCPMTQKGCDTDCHTRCRKCKVAEVSVGVPFYLPPSFPTTYPTLPIA